MGTVVEEGGVAVIEPAGIESEFEPGSRGRVSRNKLGIIKVRDIHLAESQMLLLAQKKAIETYGPDHRFSAEDIRSLHRSWLGPIYSWAGEYRTVNLGKGGFQFATAGLIPGLMDKLERQILAKNTPCREGTTEVVAGSLATVHAELILIHPFRDGNGRLARMLATLMAFQARLPALTFSSFEGRGKRPYIAAIHSALGHDYAPLIAMFAKAIAETRTLAASRNR